MQAIMKDDTTTSALKAGQTIQLVTFRIGEEEFGIDIAMIQEVNRKVAITAVPNSADYIEGIINLRGCIIPVINMRKRMKLPIIKDEGSERIIVVEAGATVGMLVDSVSEVLRVSCGMVEPVPPVGRSEGASIVGVVKLDSRLLLLMDVHSIVGQQEHIQALSDN
ncbi:MAG TPA: chemotaxis protein CheW [Dissulfurispiraceae bacterium]|nr:chemotaxis protein CheW [Dissulfurispiraceae bacterium]